METDSRVDSTLDQAQAMSATRVQPEQASLADKLKSLQLANEPDRTQPNPLPVASTSSSPPRSEPDRFDPRPDRAESIEAQPKRKVVLLKRPETPTRSGEGSPSRTAAAPREESRIDPIGTLEEARRTSDAGLRDPEPEHAVDQDEGSLADPAALDPVVRGALSYPRDRFLLLRAEVELERFVLNSTIARLPLAPPHFQPGLNSYQRLLIHRLADMFGITREVEPAPPTLWNAGMINPATGQPQGVVVLVKGEAAAIPIRKLASYVPAPEPAPSAVSSPVPHPPIVRNSSALSSPAASPDEASPAAPVGASAPPPPPPVFKILPRASRGTSSASSSADVDDDGTSSLGAGSRSRLRRDLTLEEREAAYKEARERIFSQPDPVERSTPAPSTASAASSIAGEDAVSVQSLGYGITRPSSAGSTFSRSSAALSVSGQRPPPSIASDSNPAIRPGYYGGFYQQQQPPSQQPALGGMPYPMPNLRPAAPPVFDPATGGWTYAPTTEFTAASPYSMPYGAVQPPPPPPMPYQSPPPPVSQFDSGSVATPSAWHRSLPSPALSGSSGSSYPPQVYHQQHQHQQQQHAPPAAQSPSSGASGASSSDTGYLMRFPEGAIVTAAGAVVGPPQPYAAVAVGASLRSPSSASLGASSSASRVATRGGTSTGPNSLRRLSQSTTQSLGSMQSYSAPPSDDAASRRSPSATSGAADDSPEASLLGENFSEVGSSVGGEGSAPPSLVSGGSDGKRRGRQTTIVSRGGRAERERSLRPEGESGDDVDDKTRERGTLHPSLPAKPSWAAAAGGGAVPTVQGEASSPSLPLTGQAASPSTSRTNVTPSRSDAPVSLRDLPGLATSLRGPPSTASSSPGGAAFPPLSAAAPTVLPPPPPPPPGPGPWSRPNPTYAAQAPGPNAHGGQPNGYPPQYATATPPQAPYPPQQPSSYSTWLSHAAQGPPPSHVGYAPPSRLPQGTQMYAHSGLEGGAVPVAAPKLADLMTMPDMRRPPPRSTQLFDPNKPGNSGNMRRVASGAGSARGRP